MDSACQGGINYWCKRILYDGKNVWKKAYQYISNDLPLQLISYDGDEYVLTKENMVKAIEKHCADVEIFFDKKGRRRIDTDIFPCDIADLIIREACSVND